MHLLWLVFFLLFALSARAQTLKCNSVPGGCDQGKANDAALRGAVARFDTSKGYGGQSNIFSTFLSGNALAQISYTCQGGSNSPVIDGSQAQSLLSQIISCDNQCGSITLSGNDKCGFGVLIAANVSSQDCFSKAINVVPQSTNKPAPPHPPPPPPPPVSTTTTATPAPPVPSSVITEDANDVDNKVKDAQSKSNSFSNDPSDKSKSDLQKAIDDASKSAKKAQNDAKTDSSKWSEFLNHINDVVKSLDDAAVVLTGPPSGETAVTVAVSIAAATTAAAAAKSSTNPPENSPPATSPPATPESQSPSSTQTSTSTTTQSCDLCVACADSALPPGTSSDATDVPDNDPPAATKTGVAARGIVKRANVRKQVGPFCNVVYSSRAYAQGTSGQLFPYYGYTHQVSTTTCNWKPVFVNQPAGPEPRTKAGSYATEHVFEAQLVSQFIKSFDQSCTQAGFLKTYLVRDGNWPGLQGAAAQPFRRSNYGPRQGTSSAAALDELMDNLSANADAGELFYLDEDLNALKAAVFSGSTGGFSSANVAKEKLAIVTRMCMLYKYLENVKKTYLKVSRRMYVTMQKLDQTIASSTIQPPRDSAGNAISFAQKYKDWEDHFLFFAGSTVNLSMESILKAAKDQISTDDKLGSKAIRDQFLASVNTLTGPGTLCDPSKWLDLDDLLSLDKNP
ncbi:MAG: hypothetical protein M1839_003278 [Geoglossum umbratile]|nr:MAG: hypothetical protein M1839_003278 [Geoglossum umbratile]